MNNQIKNNIIDVGTKLSKTINKSTILLMNINIED